MGSPELPDPGEDEVRPTQLIQHVPIVNDESDNEIEANYDGYEPLTMDEQEADGHTYSVETPHSIDDVSDGQHEEEGQIATHDSNLPHVESADVEIERQIWNEPRPETLQIEMDSTRTEQILSAMANFTLPATVVPEWAAGVSEERWKEDLLQRIRQRKDTSCGRGESSTTKEHNCN